MRASTALRRTPSAASRGVTEGAGGTASGGGADGAASALPSEPVALDTLDALTFGTGKALGGGEPEAGTDPALGTLVSPAPPRDEAPVCPTAFAIAATGFGSGGSAGTGKA